MDVIRERLDEQIVSDLENLKHMTPGTPEYDKAVESIAKLYGVRIEEDKSVCDKQEKTFRFVRVAVDGAGIVLPLIFYGVWMKRGFQFEKDGTFTSTTFRGFFGKFKPNRI